MEASEQHSNFGEVLRRLRQEAGLSQAGLAGAAGTSLRQIHRYERGEQQPALDVGMRLASALGVTLDELAGGSTDRVKLDGTWWAAWQTFNDGQQVIATQPVGLSQHGATVQIEALERSTENEQGGYLWRGELRLWDGQVLMGYYAAADGNVRSKGTMSSSSTPRASTPTAAGSASPTTARSSAAMQHSPATRSRPRRS